MKVNDPGKKCNPTLTDGGKIPNEKTQKEKHIK